MKPAAVLSMLGLVLFGGMGAGRAQIVPVELDNSGFLTDAVWESTGGYSGDLSGDTTATTSYVLETGDEAAINSGGDAADGALPEDGTITSPSPSSAVFQLQPYDEPNVLVLDATPGTLTLAPSAQAMYSEISFLVSNLTSNRNAQGAVPVSFTLNYTDGNSVTLPVGAPVPNILTAPGSAAEAAAALTSYVQVGSARSDSAPIYLDEYDFPLAEPGEILQSVTIDPGGNLLDVYAISGIDPSPEPKTWLLLAASLLGLGLLAHRTRRPAARVS